MYIYTYIYIWHNYNLHFSTSYLILLQITPPPPPNGPPPKKKKFKKKKETSSDNVWQEVIQSFLKIDKCCKHRVKLQYITHSIFDNMLIPNQDISWSVQRFRFRFTYFSISPSAALPLTTTGKNLWVMMKRWAALWSTESAFGLDSAID